MLNVTAIDVPSHRDAVSHSVGVGSTWQSSPVSSGPRPQALDAAEREHPNAITPHPTCYRQRGRLAETFIPLAPQYRRPKVTPVRRPNPLQIALVRDRDNRLNLRRDDLGMHRPQRDS